jgi:hypothetical protein
MECASFIWMEIHSPFLYPVCQFVEVILEYNGIFVRSNFSVENTVIRKVSYAWLYTVREIAYKNQEQQRSWDCSLRYSTNDSDLPTDPLLAGHTRPQSWPAAGHRFHPQNHPPKIDAKLAKKDNSNSIKIGCPRIADICKHISCVLIVYLYRAQTETSSSRKKPFLKSNSLWL